jgi:hypothetical protein
MVGVENDRHGGSLRELGAADSSAETDDLSEGLVPSKVTDNSPIPPFLEFFAQGGFQFREFLLDLRQANLKLLFRC